jgi:hypothetical protein
MPSCCYERRTLLADGMVPAMKLLLIVPVQLIEPLGTIMTNLGVPDGTS